MSKNRILLIAGAITALTVLVAGAVLAYLSSPVDMRVTNVTDRSFTLSWKSRMPTSGLATVKQGDNWMPVSLLVGNEDKGFDDRDWAAAEVNIEESAEVKVEKIGKFYTHHVTVKSLSPETDYTYYLGSNRLFAVKKGLFTSMPELESLPTPNPAYGTVVDRDGDRDFKRAPDSLVYLYLMNGEDRSALLSAVANEEGTYYIDLTTARFSQFDTVRMYADGAGQGRSLDLTLNDLKTKPFAPIVLEDELPAETENGSQSSNGVKAVLSAVSFDSIAQSCNPRTYPEGRCEGRAFCEYEVTQHANCTYTDRKVRCTPNSAECGDTENQPQEEPQNPQQEPENPTPPQDDEPQDNLPNGCCKGNGQTRSCPNNQSCSISNGACGDGGVSCDPNSGQSSTNPPLGDNPEPNSNVGTSCYEEYPEERNGLIYKCYKRGVYTNVAGDCSWGPGSYCEIDNSQQQTETPPTTATRDCTAQGMVCSDTSVNDAFCPETAQCILTSQENQQQSCNDSATGEYCTQNGVVYFNCGGTFSAAPQYCKDDSSGMENPLHGNNCANSQVGRYCIEPSGSRKYKCTTSLYTLTKQECDDHRDEWGSTAQPSCESMYKVSEGHCQSNGNVRFSCNISGRWEITSSAARCDELKSMNEQTGATTDADGVNVCPGGYPTYDLNGSFLKCTSCRPPYREVGDVCMAPGSKSSTTGSSSRENLSFRSFAQSESITISPQNGFLAFEEGGEYCTEYQGARYCFTIIDNEPVKVFIDENDNKAYDTNEVILSEQSTNLSLDRVASTQSYKLSNGFNLISFDLVNPEMDNASEFLIEMNEKFNNQIYSIARFEGGKWEVMGYRAGEVVGAIDFQLVPGKGYLVKTKANVDIYITGQRVSDPVPVFLTGGWNLVAVHGASTSYTAESLIDAVESVEGLDADNVTKWAAEKGRYEGVQKQADSTGTERVFGFDFPIVRDASYFVRVVEGQGEWTPQ